MATRYSALVAKLDSLRAEAWRDIAAREKELLEEGKPFNGDQIRRRAISRWALLDEILNQERA
jgi:hypothetical protein